MSKLFILSLSAFLLLASSASAQQYSPAELLRMKAAEEEAQHQELVNLQQETVRALQLNNATFFRRVYSDDFIGTAPGGQILDKTALLASVQYSNSKYTTFLATDVRVRIFENTAVVTCLWTSRGTSEGRAFTRQSRVTNVYVYGGRGWQTVASQETLLPG